MAIRAALGSGRTRLIRQMLTESVFLSLLGAAAGVAVGNWVSQVFANLLPKFTPDLPVLLDVSFDWRVFSYAFTAALAAGGLIGIWPALQASRADAGAALHDGSRTNSSGPQRQRLRGFLVAGQVAGSLVLLVAAGLFVRSLQAAQGLNLGFAPDHLLNARMNPEWIGYDQQHAKDFYQELERRVRAWPEVRSASLAFSVPMGLVGAGDAVYVEGHPVNPGEQPPVIGFNTVDPNYFDTMRMPIVRGRAFRESDSEATPLVAVVNEALIRKSHPGENLLGRTIFCSFDTRRGMMIVGVVGDARQYGPAQESRPECYMPYQQHQYNGSTLSVLVRTAGDPTALAASPCKRSQRGPGSRSSCAARPPDRSPRDIDSRNCAGKRRTARSFRPRPTSGSRPRSPDRRGAGATALRECRARTCDWASRSESRTDAWYRTA